MTIRTHDPTGASCATCVKESAIITLDTAGGSSTAIDDGPSGRT